MMTIDEQISSRSPFVRLLTADTFAEQSIAAGCAYLAHVVTPTVAGGLFALPAPAPVAVQNVTQILVFDHEPSADNPASIVDIIELDGPVCEAAQTFRRHYVGGRWAGVFAGNFVAVRAGYTLSDDGRVLFPLAYGRLS